MHDHHTVELQEVDGDIGPDEEEHAGRLEVSWQARERYGKSLHNNEKNRL